ncbi:MAG: hypothetical protein ACI9MR_000058 [Myxococcota bacterium]|jgi:uncharacterized protein (DUF924 family)
MSDLPSPKDVLDFWFGALGSDGNVSPDVAARWWRKSDDFDAEIRQRFGALHTAATTTPESVEHWLSTPEGAVALTIVLDQFSRNLGRDTPAAFAHDGQGLSVMEQALERGHWDALADLHRYFLVMPAMHSEDLAVHAAGATHFAAARDQARSEATREALTQAGDFLKRHTVIIERFGRYPHRNAILGRTSTEAERAYLEDGGETF